MRRNWPVWTGCGTALWSLTYGVLGVWWSLGGAGYPFATVDEDHATASLLEGTPSQVVAPVLAVTGLAGAVVATLMTLRRTRSTALLGYGGVMAVVLALVVPDYTPLAMLALSPALVVFAFTGVPGEQGGVGDILYWHRVNLLLMFAGGLLWAATVVAHHRRTRGACVSCGRSGRVAPRWTTPEAALRWGRWAVLVAVAANVPYEVTRVAWYFGWPLGITDEFHQMMVDTPGMLEMGLAMALLGAGGGLLTHGLVHRWGEVYPRWIPVKGGHRVGPRVAIVPASIVAVVLVPAGLMNLRFPGEDLGAEWGLTMPGVLWIVWGVALGAATYAYHLRRRTTCRTCGRGPARSDILVARAGERARGPRDERVRDPGTTT